jgi:pyruvate dehydrogenase E2 component (dihydrolipoamide acetyltransferase)
MALIALELPKIGIVMEEVRVTRWMKSVGDIISMGEPLLEVETEKSVVEIEAAVSGRLVEILVHVDQAAKVGDQIAWVETAEAATAPQPELAPRRPDPPPREPAQARPQTPNIQDRVGSRVRSSPVARRLAVEHGLNLGGIVGSGPGGRVQLADVRSVLGKTPVKAPPSVDTQSSPRLSPMRRALARAMSLSNATVPQFTVERAVDWTTVQALRAQFAASLTQGSPKLSLNDFLLQAVARTLIEMPAMNATFAGDVNSADAHVVPASGAHVGLVVAVDNGVLVPVIHGVERLTLAEIARRRADCVERGLKGRLKRDELEGATFSISNLGARGPDRFAAMINPPESAILAVGRQHNCAVAANGGVEVRPLSELTLTVDHRVADGRLAAEFLARLVEILEARDWTP